MLNLREYRDRTDRLVDHLPWAALVAPGVVLNKDGSFQRTFAFRGPDLESATEGELMAACARANNVLRRFGSGWALFFEAARSEAVGYPESSFPDPISQLVDLERRADFEAAGQHFESRFHMTLLWLPPADAVETLGRTLIDRPDTADGRDWRGVLQRFIEETDRALDLFGGFMPEIHPLSDAETLTYLHGTISLRQQSITVPDVPMYLDAVLADTPLLGGIEPKLGDHHLRTVTVLGFPPLSRPAILDALNHQNFSYRWVSRFIPLDKVEASKALTSLRRQWFNKRKSVTALLREVLYNQPAQLLDSDADNKVIDADQALQALGGDLVSFGYLTVTITVTDVDRNTVDDKIRAVERIVNGLGFSTIKEGVNAVEAWLSSIPGNPYANVRQPLVHTLNIAHLMPLAGVWAGHGAPIVFGEMQMGLHDLPPIVAQKALRVIGARVQKEAGSARDQIQATREALVMPDALGVIVLISPPQRIGQQSMAWLIADLRQQSRSLEGLDLILMIETAKGADNIFAPSPSFLSVWTVGDRSWPDAVKDRIGAAWGEVTGEIGQSADVDDFVRLGASE